MYIRRRNATSARESDQSAASSLEKRSPLGGAPSTSTSRERARGDGDVVDGVAGRGTFASRSRRGRVATGPLNETKPMERTYLMADRLLEGLRAGARPPEAPSTRSTSRQATAQRNTLMTAGDVVGVAFREAPPGRARGDRRAAALVSR